MVNYIVTFTDDGNPHPNEAAYQIFKGTTPVPQSLFGTGIAGLATSVTPKLQVVGEAIISIAAGDIITLRNVGTTDHINPSIDPVGTRSKVNSASLTLVLLNEA
ncbi:hypothetical protein RGU12_05315 [Fredinandcohnia sp. QZ13]|uniref:hypothetical protein n=1 Tax=Fredinandcohnia sp. QZ13 TaxID=3073144 RepID=UPI0028536B89|nr:hypothetical protein [Fredinandcohnia sp. QZ13]MDR4886972.1 hypothetical protein [Fredinandcohnia sp. QZ13]